MAKQDGYQLVLHVGASPGIAAAHTVEIKPEQSTPDAVLDAIRISGVSPSDFRSQALVSFDCDPALAVMVYAALCGFATRRLDFTVDGVLVPAAPVDATSRRLPDAGKPDAVPSQVQVGMVAHESLSSVLFDKELTAEAASLVRYARRVRFVPADNTRDAVLQFLVVAGMRARERTDRFPYLCDGTEPAPSPDAPIEVVGVCLDTLRQRALELRREHRSGSRDSLAESVMTSPRQNKLLLAGLTDIEAAMRALGGRQNADTGLWHCPRPERHTNGDANASMRVNRGKTRCYRCDGERVDALRLAVDVLGVTPDEAAHWLLENCPAS